MSPASILVIGLGIVLALPLAARAVARRFDPFEPIVLFALAYGIVFVARPATILIHGDLSFGDVDIRRTFPLVTALALAGGVAFVVGYEVRPGVALARRLAEPREITTRAAVAWSLALTAIAALALTAMRTGIAGGTNELGSAPVASDYVSIAARLFVPAALCLVALAVRERSRRISVLAALVLAASLTDLVPEGRRIFLLPLLGGIFVFVYVHRHKRPSALILLAVTVAALFASYAVVLVRENASNPFAQLVHRPDKVIDLILYRGDAEMAPVLAGALTVVPERLRYRYGGATIGDLLARPIPRQLWHGKPEDSEKRITVTVWPKFAAGNFHPDYTPLLEFYWDFGVAGVVAGMALFGIGCRTLYEWFRRHAGSFGAQLIFSVALWYVVIGIRDAPVDTVVLAGFGVFPLVLVGRFSAFGRSFVRFRPALARFQQR